MTLSEFLNQVKSNSKRISFQDTIAVIDANYQFIPTTFSNGNQLNKAGENNGSCKIFAFAKLQNLSQNETLACFGSYYFEDVLQNSEANDHQNIRNFMQKGWEGIHFEGQPLVASN